MVNIKIEDYDYIMTFTSHNRALYIYQHLFQRNIQVKLVSSPNKINISCTQAVKFKEIDKKVVQEELKKNNMYPTAVYRIVKEGKKENYELIE
ncbi:DUF3343 domain-containing protein [Clostridium weizhouense]|uniref:DUF3343 domain-containing protein n=1 Tax=Clostridium weizhouense TaxID=2859781 RepID=UPI0027E4B098|nr:DUF3343 domain-containing protein [Clostridium weizhouense]